MPLFDCHCENCGQTAKDIACSPKTGEILEECPSCGSEKLSKVWNFQDSIAPVGARFEEIEVVDPVTGVKKAVRSHKELDEMRIGVATALGRDPNDIEVNVLSPREYAERHDSKNDKLLAARKRFDLRTDNIR